MSKKETSRGIRPTARTLARRRRHLAEVGAITLAAALWSGDLHAQEALPTIDIRRPTQRRTRTAPPVAAEQTQAAPSTGEPLGRGPTGVVGYVATGTSTATKTKTPIMRIPQSVTILTKQQLEDRGAQSLGQALTYVPGVTVAQGEGQRDQITIRGQNTTADFFLDGVRDDAEYFRDLYNIQAVEALKGPSALIFGRGGGGGVINRVTKKADGTTLYEGLFSTGSWGRKRVTIDAGRAVSDDVDVRLNALYENSHNFRNFFELERYGFNPTVTIRPSDSTTVMLSYEHFGDRRTVDRGVPSLNGRPSPAPIDAFFGNPVSSYARFFSHAGTATIEHKTDFGVEIYNHTFVKDIDKLYQNSFADSAVSLGNISGVPAGFVKISGYLDETLRQSVFNQTDLTYKFEMSPDIRHTLLAGAEVGNQVTDNDRNNALFNNPFTGLGSSSINTPFFSPTVFNAVFFTNPTRRRDTELDAVAGYLQDQIEITQYIDVIAGIRFDNFDLKFRNGLDGQRLARVDNIWSPRAGLVVKPFEELSLYGSWSRSFLPSGGDQFNVLTVTESNLEPQGFLNYEAGFKAQVLPRLFFTGALYQLDRTNVPIAAGPFANTQVGLTRTRGGEITLTGYLTDEWQVALGYGHQAAKVLNGNAADIGKTVPSVPRDTFSFWNRYDFTPILGAGVGVVHNAKFFSAIDNAVVISGYTRVDGAVFFNFGKNVFSYGEELSAQVNIENVLGEHYFISAQNNNNISPGAPRAVYVTINAKL